MALSDDTKLATSFKKLRGKAQSETSREDIEEQDSSFILSPSKSVQISQIDQSKSDAIASGRGVVLTVKTDEIVGTNNRGWKTTGIQNWYDPSLTQDPSASGFTVEIFEDDGGGSPDLGKQIFDSDVLKPIFDYQAGIISFQEPTARSPVFPPHVRAVKNNSKTLDQIQSRGGLDVERRTGRVTRKIDVTSDPSLTGSIMVDAVYANGYVWFLDYGSGSGTSQIIGFDAITKKEHPGGPILLKDGGGSTGVFRARAITSDGKTLYVVAHVIFSPSTTASAYLWKINTETLEQKFFDLTGDPENGLIRAFTIWNWGIGVTSIDFGVSSTLDVTVEGSTDSFTLSGVTSIASVISNINTNKTLDFEARQSTTSPIGQDKIAFLAGNSKLDILISNTATGFGDGVEGSTSIRSRGPGFRAVDFDPKNRNLWISDATNKHQPFVWNVDSETTQSKFEDMLWNGLFTNPGTPVYVLGGKAVIGLDFPGTPIELRWDVDGLVPDSETSIEGFAFGNGIAFDGKFAYDGATKIDVERNLTTHIQTRPPVFNSMPVVTDEALFLVSKESNIIRKISKADMRFVEDFALDDFEGMTNIVNTAFQRVPFDGVHLWVYQSHFLSSPGNTTIQQIPVELGINKSIMRKGDLFSIESRVYEASTNIERLKNEENAFVGKIKNNFNQTHLVNGLSGLALGDLAYFTTARWSDLQNLGDTNETNIEIHVHNMLDANNSRDDDIEPGMNRYGNNHNPNLRNATAARNLTLFGSNVGLQNQFLSGDVLNITNIQLDSLGNIWITNGGFGPDNRTSIIAVNPVTKKVIFDFSIASGSYLKTVIFDNVVDSLGAEPKMWGVSVNDAHAGLGPLILGTKIDKETNEVEGANNELAIHRGVIPSLGVTHEVIVPDLGHGGTTKVKDIDKINEWVIIVDDPDVFLVDISSVLESAAPRFLKIPEAGADIVHSNQNSIFIGKGTSIDEWRFNPNRIMLDKFAASTTGVDEIDFSQPITEKIKVGDLVLIKSGANAGTYEITSIPATAPAGKVVVTPSIPSSVGTEEVEVFSFERITFASGFVDVTHIHSDKDFIYVVDGGVKPFVITDPAFVYRFDYSTSVLDFAWSDFLDISYLTYEQIGQSLHLLAPQDAGETTTITSSDSGSLGTVEVYGVETGSGLAKTDTIAWSGTTPAAGTILFDKVFGAKIFITIPDALPVTGSITVSSTTTGTTLMDFANKFSGALGVWCPDRFPHRPLSNEFYGKVSFRTDGVGPSDPYDVFISGKDLSGTPVSEIVSVSSVESQSSLAYSVIEAISFSEFVEFTDPHVFFRAPRPVNITHVASDGNHFVMLDSNSDSLFKKVM